MCLLTVVLIFSHPATYLCAIRSTSVLFIAPWPTHRRGNVAHKGQRHHWSVGEGADIRFCPLSASLPQSKLEVRIKRHTKAYENTVALKISAEENMGPAGCSAHSNRGGDRLTALLP